MKKRNEKCEECNGHITYDHEIDEYRCNECGSITDDEGVVLHDVSTMYKM